MRYQLIDYDTIGNSRDGYEVNDAHLTSTFVDLKEDATNKDIISALKKVGYLKANLRTKSFDIDGGYTTIYITYNTRKKPMFYLCELRQAPEE